MDPQKFSLSDCGASSMVNSVWANLFRRDKREQELISILKENYIFSSLNASELWFLKELVHVRTYAAGESIFRQGEIGIGMYIVSRGLVDVHVEDLQVEDTGSGSLTITRLGAGDFFGEIALVEEGGRRSASATAVDECALIGFFKPDLLEIAARNPVTGNKILLRLSEVLGRRLKETADKVSELKREIRTLKESS